MKTKLFLLFIISLTSMTVINSQEIYTMPENTQTRWISAENYTGDKGKGGMTNQQAKGSAFETILAGEQLVLADIKGTGVINRMWLTLSDRSPEMLRSLKLEMFWDDAVTPAVQAPFGDFFGAVMGHLIPFESAILASPEGRSFVSYIKMPFRKAAKIILTNESEKDLRLIFYDVNYSLTDNLPDNALYFHAYWHRENYTTLKKDFEILPHVEGKGLYLGTHIGVRCNPIYGKTWWGEGEVKVYLDGDKEYPSLVGTGTEDYIGSGWSQGVFTQMYHGCTLANNDTTRKNNLWAFYRLHIPDPVYFYKDCKVTIQQIGGSSTKNVITMLNDGVKMQPVSISTKDKSGFTSLLAMNPVPDLRDPNLPKTGWTNFYREDDVCAVVYFYLDKPGNSLKSLQPVAERITDLD